MRYDSLKEFIARLDAEGELVRVRESVSPVLEIAEIADRVSKQPGGGRALLFENVEGSAFPVLINAFGSRRRTNLGLGDVERIARDIERYLKLPPPAGWVDKLKLLPMLFEAAHFPPRFIHGRAPCQEVVLEGDAVDLGRLPILQCWPKDAGRFITFPIVINRSADGRLRNIGLYRMQVFDKRTTAMHWHIHKDGAHFFHDYKRQNKTMEVAVAIGADPAVCYAASAPLPYGIDEFLLAGFIRKAPVSLVKCLTVDLEVPANAEIVLEGTIDPGELRTEGPFGDHTGYYSQDGDYPVFHVRAITHRRNAIYHTTLVGKPPQEDLYLGKATERIFLPLMRTQLPEIADMNMPAEGVFHNLLLISLEKRYPMQARRLMSALWGLGQMSFVKTIVAVDDTVDVQDVAAVARRVLSTVRPKRDLFFSEGVLDVLNHASDQALYGSKLGIDATAKIPGEPGHGEGPPAPPGPLPTAGAVQARFGELAGCRFLEVESSPPVLFASIDKIRPGQGRDFLNAFFAAPEFSSISVCIVIDLPVDLSDTSLLLWKFLNNLDPRRDLALHGERLGIDVTRKTAEEGYTQHWPEEIEMDAGTRARVDANWDKFYPEKIIS
ncbi:MAG: menaquinone biosynthesis decarboxylase [Nitrospinaceae bacterium]|nr:MAG: menaquinone biosynthesis decarboxylase [Nitrospinaceae bacterium]